MFDFFSGIVKAIGGAIVSFGMLITGGSAPVVVDEVPVDVVIEDTTTINEISEEINSPQQPANKESPTEATQPVIVVDVCTNIEGIQSSVPAGYTFASNICTLIVKEDRCFNIDGIQEKVPNGLILTREIGCVTESEYDEHIDSRAPESEPEPKPTYAEIRSLEIEDDISKIFARAYASQVYENKCCISQSSADKLELLFIEYRIYNDSFWAPGYNSSKALPKFVIYWEAWLSNKYNKEYKLPISNYKD
jgi:hypothetical protein